MALPKLYDLITWHNNTTPALNEDNLNAMSQAIDDIDDRVIDLAGTIMEDVPQIIEDMEILGPAVENIDENVARAEAAAESAEDSAESAEEWANIANPPIVVTKDFASIITMDDAINKPVKDLKVKVAPVQDLHGYTKPWVGGAGGNMLPKEADYVLTVATSNEYSTHVVTDIPIVSGKTYTISCLQKNALTSNIRNTLGVIYNGQTIWESTDTNYHLAAGRHTLTFTSNYTGVCTVDLWSHTPSTQVQYTEFMMEEGSAFTSYRPYSNICPITGHSEAKVTRVGKNLLSGIEQGAYVANSGYPISSDKYCRTKKVTIKGGATVAFSIVTSKTTALTPLYWKGSTFIGHGDTSEDATSAIATIPENADTIAFDIYNSTALSTTDITSAQIEAGSTPTGYEVYIEPTEYTISLDGTRYGGVLDVDTGTLTLKSGIVLGSQLTNVGRTTSYTVPFFYGSISGSKNSGSLISSDFETIDPHDAPTFGLVAKNGQMSKGAFSEQIFIRDDRYTSVSDFQTAIASAQFVYELATPQTIQLTAEEVTLLWAYNTLWADTGDLSLTYDASGVLRIANAKLDIDTFKSVVAASSDFADFKTRVAAL